MATRPIFDSQFQPIMTFTVAANKVVTKGMPVNQDGADDMVEDAGAAHDTIIGFALDSGTAGQRVRVALSGPVVMVLVGTGDSTRGTKQIPVTDGVTDAAAHDSSGATNDVIVGIALQSGVAGDLIGMIQTPGNRGSA